MEGRIISKFSFRRMMAGLIKRKETLTHKKIIKKKKVIVVFIEYVEKTSSCKLNYFK
jgi:hypothetical protein